MRIARRGFGNLIVLVQTETSPAAHRNDSPEVDQPGPSSAGAMGGMY